MAKYEQGEKVYRARIHCSWDGKPRLVVGEATVKGCGNAVVFIDTSGDGDLSAGDNGWAFGFACRPTLSSVYPSRRAALEALLPEAEREVAEAQKALDRRKAEAQAVREALDAEENERWRKASKEVKP